MDPSTPLISIAMACLRWTDAAFWGRPGAAIKPRAASGPGLRLERLCGGRDEQFVARTGRGSAVVAQAGLQSLGIGLALRHRLRARFLATAEIVRQRLQRDHLAVVHAVAPHQPGSVPLALAVT